MCWWTGALVNPSDVQRRSQRFIFCMTCFTGTPDSVCRNVLHLQCGNIENIQLKHYLVQRATPEEVLVLARNEICSKRLYVILSHVIGYLAIALTPSNRIRNHRLVQSPPHRYKKAANASLTTICAKGGACRPHPRTFCQSQQGQQADVQQEGPDISRLDPALQQQWDHAANAHLGNIVIKPQSAKKVMWTCDQCPDGHLHSWSARVSKRTRGTGCPQCSGRAVCKHNSLATKAPLVAAQWRYEANEGTPDDILAQSNRSIKWHCQVCGCDWKAAPGARVSKKKSGCPRCADNAQKARKRMKHPTFAECQHPLLAEWDHEHNAAQGHYPSKIPLKSEKQIFWLCTNCLAGQEHGWAAMPHNRTGRNKTGCPFCAGHAACRCNSLEALYPDTAAEWDYSKNQGQPSDHTGSSTHLAWWSSPQRGSWQQTIASRTSQVHWRNVRLIRVQQRQTSARHS